MSGRRKKHVGIRTKIYLCSFITVAISAFLFSMGTYLTIRSDILEKSIMDYQMITNNVAATLNSSMKDVIRCAELMVTDRTNINYMQNSYNKKKNFDYFQVRVRIEEQLKTMMAINSPLIDNMVLVDRAGELIAYDERLITDLMSDIWTDKYYDAYGFLKEQDSYYYVFSIVGNSPDHKIGKLILSLNEEELFGPLDTIDTKDLQMTITDQNETRLAGAVESERDFEVISRHALIQSDWQLISKINPQFLRQNLYHLTGIIIVLLVVVLFISYSIFTPILKLIINPLIQLTQSIKTLDLHSDTQLPVVRSHDEIGMIAGEYQKMVSRVRTLITRIKKQKETEVNLYMAQVNPHFVYNTLYAMVCVAESKQETEIAEKISNVANILCCSLYSKLDSFHTIKEEMHYVNQYVDILRYKYGDSLSIQWNVPEHLEHHKIGVLLLYPIVENAIFHGLSQSEDKKLLVTMEDGGEEVVISVIDHGLGMSRETIYTIYNRFEQYIAQIGTEEVEAELEKTRMGLMNVSLRLYFLYGKNTRLKIESHMGKGTKVTMNIKKV